MSNFLLNPYIMQPIEMYNYGDGSLNTTTHAYNGLVKVNGETMYVPPNYLGTGNYSGFQAQTSPGNLIIHPFVSYFQSQWTTLPSTPSPIGVWTCLHTNDTGYGQQYITSGTNTRNFTLSGEKTLYIQTMAAYLTGSLTIGSFKLLINETYYTIQEAVTNSLIKPLVLIGSQYLNYIYTSPLNVYNGGTTDGGNFSYLRILLMTNNNHNYGGIQFVASKATHAQDGLTIAYTDINNFRMTI